VLVCHGANDPLIPPEQVAAFEAQMRETTVDGQVCVDGGTVHSFTNPDAGKLGNPALADGAAADRCSWAAMVSLFEEAFSSR
jgi:dienelactone hydrolase